jgi:mRNA interferase RelE/StbE
LDWSIEFDRGIEKSLSRLSSVNQRRILDFLDTCVASGDPRARGKALQGPLSGLWSYRVGDYRILALIEDARMTILVVEISHRSQVYR